MRVDPDEDILQCMRLMITSVMNNLRDSEITSDFDDSREEKVLKLLESVFPLY